MGYWKKWKPSKSQAREFAQTMDDIREWCAVTGVSHSASFDSYYFVMNGTKYRVSNHSPESSPYHHGRDEDTRYIHASKTRIIDIYNALRRGYKLDGRGNVIG